jgi:hypothetical protein
METERGKVTLKTADGDIVSKAPIDFEVPFTITSMTEGARPGQNITIKGQFLNWITGVEFPGGVTDTTFVSQSIGELVVTVPMTAKTGKLIFYGGGTEPLTWESTANLTVTLPAVTGLAPNPVKHATNLTLTGTNLDLTTGVFFTGVDLAQSTFVSKTATQLVIKVPAGAKKGKLTLIVASKEKIQTAAELDVVLPSTSMLAPTKIDPGKDLTITGMNLDLVNEIFFSGVSAPVKTFVSRTATEIVVKVPMGTLKGKLIFSVLNSTLTAESGQTLEVFGGLPPLEALRKAFYDDKVQNGWQMWGGWGSKSTLTNFASTENVRDGVNSIKVTFGGDWGGPLQLGGGNTPTAGYTHVAISIFGGAGTSGKKLNVTFKGGSKETKEVVLVEGEWTEYRFSLANDFGNPATITEFFLQDQGFSGTIFVDHIGLR